jgi:chaperonin GroEL (HSP60 family)
MTIDTGFANTCMVNNHTNNTANINNPKIYCFNDPIDTPEMLGWLDAIIENNIIRCYRQGSVYEPVPTVIFCKSISPDTSSYFETVIRLMNSVPNVPLLIVSDIHQEYMYEDIAKMCGAPWIKKYINPDIQKADIEAGLAPTPETILDFCGSAELVVSDQLKTKVINPSEMFTVDENGNRVYSDTYNMMVNYLETQVEKAKNDNAGVTEVQHAKRRLNNFKGNMVDFLIGGMTLADRNNLKASVEDAIFNCRSAAKYGVGYGANFMAFDVLHDMLRECIDFKSRRYVYIHILYEAYTNLISILYNVEDGSVEQNGLISDLFYNECPLNIRTNMYNYDVKSSIKSDVVILDTINKVLMLMFTTNQYLVQTPAHNVYSADD